MQLTPTAGTPPAPSMPAIDQARSVPWFMDMHLDGVRVRDIVEQTPRFRFEGGGKLSGRRIVPETKVAVELLAGEHGPKLERALRGLLATFDAQSGVANLESIGLSYDGASAAVNHLLGGLSWPEARITPPLDPGANSRERRQLKAALLAQAKDIDEQHVAGASWGVSYRSINVSPATTNALLNAVTGAEVPAEEIDTQTHVLVHELAHRLTEPPLHEPDLRVERPTAEQAARLSRVQLLSEGSADLITHLPGIKNDAQRRMGLPESPEQPFGSGYDMFVDALTAMLLQAGVEPRSPAHRQEVIELLERSSMEDVPGAIAALVVQRQGIDWKHHHEVADAIARIGEHGVIPQDEDTIVAAREQIHQRTLEAEELIGQLARDSRVRRERAGT